MCQTLSEEEAFDLIKNSFHKSDQKMIFTGNNLGTQILQKKTLCHRCRTQFQFLGIYPFLPCSSLKVIGQLGSSICELDLSFCQLDLNLGPLEQLCGLQTLIMDNCKLTDRHCLPYLKHLQTLR